MYGMEGEVGDEGIIGGERGRSKGGSMEVWVKARRRGGWEDRRVVGEGIGVLYCLGWMLGDLPLISW